MLKSALPRALATSSAPLTLAASLLLVPSVLAAPQTVEAVLDATVPNRPTAVTAAPGVAHQYYVATKQGMVWAIRGGNLVTPAVLDIRPAVNEDGENGLLGLAFHPDFQSNGRFYVSYTAGLAFGDSMVSEFTMLPGSVDTADPASERIIVPPIAQQTNGHKAGDIAFGPDGMLYLALGDGDAGSAGQLGTAQILSDPRGKILRLDVDGPAPHVPANNPFVGTAGVDERIWVYGLRNPWRLNVDPVTGDVYVGDVGNSTQEEVTRVTPADAGANLGWPCREGTACKPNPACACPDPSLLDPMTTLLHAPTAALCSVTGGLVVRGGDIPRLEGGYVFSDFCSGQLWLVEDPGGAANVVDLTPELGASTPIRFAVEFGQGPGGELLVARHYSGEIFRIRARAGFQVYCDSSPNSSGTNAVIAASGSSSVATANLTFDVAGLPAGAFGFFLASAGRAHVPGFGGSQGVLCLDAPILRWSARVQVADAAGDVSMSTDLTDLPPLVVAAPGRTWNFQYWTRDANPAPTSNTSDAVAVTFAP